MECPYCGAELIQTDTYGKTRYSEHYWIYPHSWIERTGDIYKCPNSEGFEDLDEAKMYQESTGDQKELVPEDVICDSQMFNGYFYTDKHDNLHEGYPC